LWRGASLVILDVKQQVALGGIDYKVPTFAAEVTVFIGTCAAFSLIFTIFASAMLGQFAPVGMGWQNSWGFDLREHRKHDC
jgi:hypothetical protein